MPTCSNPVFDPNLPTNPTHNKYSQSGYHEDQIGLSQFFGIAKKMKQNLSKIQTHRASNAIPSKLERWFQLTKEISWRLTKIEVENKIQEVLHCAVCLLPLVENRADSETNW